ncbi:15-hydroxyprostaglandin dehydrogenase [Penicillium cosmopolitanum]|uniref:15-hydroxyprostaglandin dehydrogenase n=1 Tax=Penicillium cosmopolitanum TaxID=1131564 RepID=A0A9W9W3C8_9EURO|nr:15-hydroxyprostaglandin dehydrogenase [Penicillium cosmopolitanum]KAJ5397840.1 15-hydroxyprostaglandin dehydrogenase [Penicillium cosmopolitanum]
MTHIHFDPSLLESLNDKVVVLTGGATGIGRSCIQQLCENGAKVIFGDVAEAPSREIECRLSPNAQFFKCDSANYSDQLNLFKTAFQKHGRVDIVIANAGIAIHKDPFDPNADINEAPSMKEVEVNTIGALFTARIGMHYLRRSGGGDLVLVSSIAGFKECGGLVAYTASKHGVVGIMRGLHLTATPENIRVNVICPWMTKTRLVRGIEKGWYEKGLPANEPEDVARSILICATANRGQSGKTHGGARLPFAGKILWVAGGESYEIEDGIQSLEPKWLGDKNSQVLKQGQEYLASAGTSWDESKL